MSASDQSVVLLPCPFCQSDSVYVDAWTMYRVRCGRCDSMGGGSGVRNEAIAKWNRRAKQKCVCDALEEYGNSVGQ